MSEDGSDAALDQGSDVPRGGAVPEHVEETSHRAVGSSRDGCQGHDRRGTVILSTSNSQVKFTKAYRKSESLRVLHNRQIIAWRAFINNDTMPQRRNQEVRALHDLMYS